ncbi:MAG TPA: hypothetical protein VK206_16655 [Anaerolineales bacterium]|nr:hypothetical protein [Anaerolineales bacterium]HLO29601.1 hypothetical protein [Anaerolineales bacterium]
MNTNNWKTFMMFAVRVIVAHTLTYFTYGIIMSQVFDYNAIFAREVIRDYMLAIGERNVFLHLFMQPVRGLIFAIALWPLRDLLLERKNGWLILWGLLVSIGILSTPAAAPSSIEGMVYTRIPMWYHLMGIPEIALQTLFFSIWVVWWERQSAESHAAEAKKRNPLLVQFVKAVISACFGYIGYAIGGLLLVALTRSDIDIGAAGTDFKMQFMFVVAFFINAITILWLAHLWQANPKSLWSVFSLFWFVDAIVPWLYQTLIFGGSHIPTVIILGFFPAAIITLSIWLNQIRPAIQGRT